MSKVKEKKSKKQSRKNLWMQITVGIVLIAFVVFFVLSNILKNSEPVNQDLERAMNSKSAYSFVKEGELSFTDSKGQFLQRIDIEIADDDAQRQTGLMFRDKMNMDEGMLFIFDAEEPQAFWMHNTVLPLDILYVNANMEIVSIVRNARPYDDKSLPSVKPAQYVVEVNAGYCDKFGVKEGDKIVWRRS